MNGLLVIDKPAGLTSHDVVSRVRRLLKQPIIVDTKNLLDPDRLRTMGFQYVGMGRA